MKLLQTQIIGIVLVAGALAPRPAAAQANAPSPATPAEIVSTYQSLAEGILALKRTEEGLCRAILAAGSAHARVELVRAHSAIKAGDARAAQGAIENLAAAVGQLATEGDGAIAGVRKRLVEGGHHHNSAGEAQGLFDEGYVVVNRAAKGKLLASSRAIAQMAAAPKADALEAEWKKVEALVEELLKPAK
jgi:hypothetical protein